MPPVDFVARVSPPREPAAAPPLLVLLHGIGADENDLLPLARAQGRPVLVCPGPAEVQEARERFGAALVLEGVGLGTYAALLAEAALMISNDTGPGHMAAAVQAPLLSVLGPTHPGHWRAWGPTVHLLGGLGHWPEREAVLAAARSRLAAAR